MRASIVLAGLGLLAACGDGTTPNTPDAGARPLIPVAVGHRWKYRVTSDTGVVTDKVQTITGTAAGGFRFLTQRGTSKETESVQRLEGAALIRVEEQAYKNEILQERYRFEPYMLRADGDRATTGATYESTHAKVALDARGGELARTEVRHRFTVDSASDLVEVPAGRFPAVKLTRVDLSDGSTKLYWYVPGVGKVKETGGQTEELVEYDLAD